MWCWCPTHPHPPLSVPTVASLFGAILAMRLSLIPPSQLCLWRCYAATASRVLPCGLPGQQAFRSGSYLACGRRGDHLRAMCCGAPLSPVFTCWSRKRKSNNAML
ncbi:hypothetical protein GDO81_025468 [Engystomops pustulosus]|uniref:Secreted protein n=1 Tax=Engystomops pustulosus TaxID=76066 RepID=A0AAV6YSA1_ENGPU|nr:hypothetical protein GDO81_025468 [Engystomops pustulosus]